MAKSKKKRTAVGRPITPTVLGELKALGDWPDLDREFSPEGAWTHSYRIWTCHGYVSSGNETVGALRLERKGAGAGGFTLRTRQRVVHSGGIKHSIRAEIRGRGDTIGSITGWTLASKYEGGKGPDRADLGMSRKGACRDGQVTLFVGGKTRTIQTQRPVASDWSLFEAVQRMAVEGVSPTFDVLEHLTIHRPYHRIRYGGVDQINWSGKSVKLHHYYQLGQGMLPYEYWRDATRRLVVVTTGARAYILDPKAHEKLDGKTGSGKDKRV